MKPNSKIDEYVARIERAIPTLMKSVHSSIPREIKGLKAKLTMSQMITLLRLIHKKERKELKMSELAEIANANVSAMTGIVDGLIQEGLVERERSTEDRRTVFVRLTPEGAKIARSLQNYRRKKIREAVEYLDEDKRETMVRGFEKVVEAFSVRAEEIKQGNIRDGKGES